MIGAVNAAFEAIVGLLLWPFRALDPWAGLAFVSAVTGLIMVLAFKAASDQAALGRAKDLIKAHLLEIRLYKDDLRQSLRAQGRVLAANGRYLACAVKPLLVMIVPLVLLLGHLELRFGPRPLRPGESALLKVKLAPGTSALASGFALRAPSGVTVETEALRIESEAEIDWRVRADREGRYRLALEGGGASLEKEIVAGEAGLGKVSAVRRRGLAALVLAAGEPPLPAGPVASVEIVYPPRRLAFLGLRVPWLVAYFVLSLLAGLALRRPLRAEF